MARIAPFHAVRYAPHINPAAVLTQPYDKIPPALRAEYAARSPFNLVHLILPDEAAAAAHGMDKYAWAAAQARQWLLDGVLIQDPHPSFYVYRQSFEIFGQRYLRTGFIGLCHVEPYERRVIFPHEKTLAKPKADRLALLRAMRMHCELIFLLYEDDGSAQCILDDVMRAPALTVARDDFSVENELWRVAAPEYIDTLSRALEPCQLFIADGHHRYETSLNYAMEHADDPLAQFTLAMFVNINSSLVILPTLRTVFGMTAYDPPSVRQRLTHVFDLTPTNDLDTTLAAINTPHSLPSIGWFDGHDWWTLQLRDLQAMRAAAPLHSDPWRALDVAVLHTLVIERALGIPPHAVEHETNIAYHRDPHEALQAVKTGAAQCAFFLRPTQAKQVCEVARNGEVMPQKSTDFYPKLLSGLAMYALDLEPQQPA
ncbi:MAG: DUF1015 domain-containing protein [bacterium]|nr:DUF1015 domain-containing protein [bacterium]